MYMTLYRDLTGRNVSLHASLAGFLLAFTTSSSVYLFFSANGFSFSLCQTLRALQKLFFSLFSKTYTTSTNASPSPPPTFPPAPPAAADAIAPTRWRSLNQQETQQEGNEEGKEKLTLKKKRRESQTSSEHRVDGKPEEEVNASNRRDDSKDPWMAAGLRPRRTRREYAQDPKGQRKAIKEHH